MIVDSSAVLAILFGEEDGPRLAEMIEATPLCRMASVNFVETFARYSGRRRSRDDLLDLFLAEAAIVIEPVTVEQARFARDAYERYGRGTGHPARLNLGDCFAYALAKATGEPLLFKGDDFVHIDIARA